MFISICTYDICLFNKQSSKTVSHNFNFGVWVKIKIVNTTEFKGKKCFKIQFNKKITAYLIYANFMMIINNHKMHKKTILMILLYNITV